MQHIILIVMSVTIGGYFAFRYVSMLYAFKKVIKEIGDIQKDLSQNQMVHLPMPNKHLKKLLFSFNTLLEGIQKERQTYEKQEKEFKRQIENISHDLRTPLTVILGYLKFLRASVEHQVHADKELSETINMIEHKAQIMKNLVTQFYDFSRLNANDYALQLKEVDVSRILRESLMGNYQILEEAHLQIEAAMLDSPAWVVGEESAFERIFLNLFQNAVRYADTFLCITIKERKETVSITFVNDTKLLTEEEVAHIFDRFYRQDSSRNQGGTGLGLTVSKTLAEQMGAELTASILEEECAEVNTKPVSVCFELCMKLTS